MNMTVERGRAEPVKSVLIIDVNAFAGETHPAYQVLKVCVVRISMGQVFPHKMIVLKVYSCCLLQFARKIIIGLKKVFLAELFVFVDPNPVEIHFAEIIFGHAVAALRCEAVPHLSRNIILLYAVSVEISLGELIHGFRLFFFSRIKINFLKVGMFDRVMCFNYFFMACWFFAGRNVWSPIVFRCRRLLLGRDAIYQRREVVIVVKRNRSLRAGEIRIFVHISTFVEIRRFFIRIGRDNNRRISFRFAGHCITQFYRLPDNFVFHGTKLLIVDNGSYILGVFPIHLLQCDVVRAVKIIELPNLRRFGKIGHNIVNLLPDVWVTE